MSGDIARVIAGETLVVELGPEDARLAGASSLDTYATETASAVQRALGAERTRRSIAESSPAQVAKNVRGSTLRMRTRPSVGSHSTL